MSTVKYAAKEGQKFNGDSDLEVTRCPTCHMTYAIPASLASSARAYPGGTNGGWWITCPLGHSWTFATEGVEKRLKDQIARERAQHDQTRASLVAQRGAAKRARNERDRLKHRVGNGVCPCCNRTFQQLSRHMAAKHPGYDVAEST